MDFSERAGRLREPRYLALYMAGCVAAAVLAAAVSRLAEARGIAWHTELAGGLFIGGVAASAQLAHGTWRTQPRRALLRIVVGAALGALAFGLIA